MESKLIQAVLRGLQFLWALLVLAIVGNMIADAFAGNPPVVNYAMFCAVFAMLSLIVLVFDLVRPIGLWFALPLDIFNTFFQFTCGVALAAELGVHSCSNTTYTKDNKITNGAVDRKGRCHEAQAVTAFLWFGFVAFAISTVLTGLSSRSGGSGGIGRGGIRRGPAMSQV